LFTDWIVRIRKMTIKEVTLDQPAQAKIIPISLEALRDYRLVTGVTWKAVKPSPLAPLLRERGTRNNMGFAPLLLREKGLGDEGST
jgi:hypothetical protein